MSDDSRTTLREPTPAERRAFLKAARMLAELGRAGLHIYLANDSLNLMAGPSHEGLGIPQPDRVRETVTIPMAGGGDW